MHAFKDGDAVDLVLKCPNNIHTVKPIQEEDYKEPRWVNVEADGVDETLLRDDGVAHDAYPKDVDQGVCPQVVFPCCVERCAGNHVAHTECGTPDGPHEGTEG